MPMKDRNVEKEKYLTITVYTCSGVESLAWLALVYIEKAFQKFVSID